MSNLAHTYLFIIFTSIVHIWAIVIVIAEIRVRGHPVTFREVKYAFRKRNMLDNLICYQYKASNHFRQ